jgi:hypothetical protein
MPRAEACSIQIEGYSGPAAVANRRPIHRLTPVPVEVRQPGPSALESLQSLICPLLHPLAIAARVERAEALSTTNIFRLEMRYSVRCLRRKLPKATIILGCWMKDTTPQS